MGKVTGDLALLPVWTSNPALEPHYSVLSIYAKGDDSRTRKPFFDPEGGSKELAPITISARQRRTVTFRSFDHQ